MKKAFILPLAVFFMSSVTLAQQPMMAKSKPPCNVSDGPLPTNVVGPLLGMSSVADPAEFPTRGPGKGDWGLALSGGGIRAASFSIGVMKALYDKGLMNDIDVISSVSGGGYASYWLLTSYEQDKTRAFGVAAFADDAFLNNVCELQATSDFVTFSGGLSRVVLPSKNVIQFYQQRIRRSFGNPRTKNYKENDGRALNCLNDSIKTGAAPYFILNGSVNQDLGGLAGLVEITPWYIGNPVIGFWNWSDLPKDKSWRLIDGVALSGAAIKSKLGQQINNYAKQILSPDAESIELWDGGGAENLGALPLMRRGVKNIIIVDAEEDSDYIFDGYRKLRTALWHMGIDFRVPDIDHFLKEECQTGKTGNPYYKAVSKGTAVSSLAGIDGKPISSTIYYVKMSMPPSVVVGTDNPTFQKGHTYADVRDKAIDCHKCDYKCAAAPNLSLGPNSSFARDLYLYIVNDYAMTHNSKKFKFFKFPQVLTVKQSFDRPLMEALIGLGYLEGAELKWQ